MELQFASSRNDKKQRGRLFHAKSDKIEEDRTIDNRLKAEAQRAREYAEWERLNADKAREKLAREYAEKVKEKERIYAEQLRRDVAAANRRAEMAAAYQRRAESRAMPVYVVKPKNGRKGGGGSGVVSLYDAVSVFDRDDSASGDGWSAGPRLQRRASEHHIRKSTRYDSRDDESSYDEQTISDDESESVSTPPQTRTVTWETPAAHREKKISGRGCRGCGCSDMDEGELIQFLQEEAGCCNVLFPSTVCSTFAGLVAVMFCR